MTWIRSLFAMAVALSTFVMPAAAQSVTPLDVDATCRTAWGSASTGAALRTAGNPESIGCRVSASMSEDGMGYLSPMQMCQRARATNTAAVLLNPADWKSWACADPGATLPAGSIAAALPSPPMGGGGISPDLEALYRAYASRNVMAVVPRPFYVPARFENGKDTLSRMTLSQGVWRPTYSYFPQRYFGRNILVLTAASDMSLRNSGAVAALDRLHANIAASNPALGRDIAKVVIFARGLEGVSAASLQDYANAGYDVWTAAKAADDYAVRLSLRHGTYLVNQLAFVDRHGFIRGVAANVASMLSATDSPEGAASQAIRWLRYVYGPVEARPISGETTFARLLQETVAAGRLPESPKSMPQRIVLAPDLVAQLAAFKARTDMQGTEIGANLMLTPNGLQLNTEGVKNERFRTYLAGDTAAVFAATAEEDCSADPCKLIFSGRNRLAGDFHTHPTGDLFSTPDVRIAYDKTAVSVLGMSNGDIAMQFPTMNSMVAPEESAGSGRGITNAKMAALYLSPQGGQTCATEQANERLWTAAEQAAAFGMALYVGRGDTLTRLDPPAQFVRMGKRPTLALFDANGGLVDPVDRLRIAALLREEMSIDVVAAELSPEDAFDPFLSPRSRALLQGRKLDATLIEELFARQYDRLRATTNVIDYDQKLKLAIAAPSISRAGVGPRLLFEGPWCFELAGGTATVRWVLRPRSLVGTGLSATYRNDPITPWARLVTNTDPKRIAEGCAIELHIYRAADAVGQRQIDYYCEGGDAFRGRFNESSQQLEGATSRQPRWKP